MTTTPQFEPLLTADQAAALLSIHPKTLQRLARTGRVPAYAVLTGGTRARWRFKQSDLTAYAAENANLAQKKKAGSVGALPVLAKQKKGATNGKHGK